MADYRLPMDADGVKYHGTVDQNEENPGHFMYGLDENGNKRIIRTDEQGNVLTRLTGSNVAETIDTDFIITAGNTMGMGILELDGVNQISIGLRLALAKKSPDIKIFYRWRSRAGLLDNSRSEFEYEVGNEGSYIRMLTKRLTLVTNSVAIYIENSGNQDVEASSLEVFKYV